MDKQQLETYLARIGYRGPRERTGRVLDALVKAHLCTVPFENLTPFEFGEVPSLEEGDLLRKLLKERRGGYCFELNTAFRHLLEALGFQVYQTVVRIFLEDGALRPYAHEAVIARAEDRLWYCDVGFGGPGPKGVVELREGEQTVAGAVYQVLLPEGSGEIQLRENGSWRPLMRFPLHPIEPCDFEPLNYYMGGRPGFGFRVTRVVNLTLPEGSKALTGDHLTIRRGGEVTERDLTSPGEVEQVLREEFGIEISLPRREA